MTSMLKIDLRKEIQYVHCTLLTYLNATFKHLKKGALLLKTLLKNNNPLSVYSRYKVYTVWFYSKGFRLLNIMLLMYFFFSYLDVGYEMYNPICQ